MRLKAEREIAERERIQAELAQRRRERELAQKSAQETGREERIELLQDKLALIKEIQRVALERQQELELEVLRLGGTLDRREDLRERG